MYIIRILHTCTHTHTGNLELPIQDAAASLVGETVEGHREGEYSGHLGAGNF